MAELHIIGQIYSGYGFPDEKLFCKWGLHCGGGWKLLQGIREGQSQTDMPVVDDIAYFCHPIDVHLTTRTMQGRKIPTSSYPSSTGESKKSSITY